MTKYLVNTGLNIPPARRVEPGETLDASELDKSVIPTLLDQGDIIEVKGKPNGIQS